MSRNRNTTIKHQNINVIQTEKMTKKYGGTIEVANLSIIVREVEIYEFLGLNGAGKTTAIRFLFGMINPH